MYSYSTKHVYTPTPPPPPPPPTTWRAENHYRGLIKINVAEMSKVKSIHWLSTAHEMNFKIKILGAISQLEHLYVSPISWFPAQHNKLATK